MKQRTVIITQACVTAGGDRFPGNKYDGEGSADLVRDGLAKWVEEPTPEPEESNDAGGESGERVLCQIEGCRRYGQKLVECPECKQMTCPDHMDEEKGICLPCGQGDDD